jgi:hypothetical protein
MITSSLSPAHSTISGMSESVGVLSHDLRMGMGGSAQRPFSPFRASAFSRRDPLGMMRRVPIWSCLSRARMSLIRKDGCAIRGNSRAGFFLGVFWRDLLFCRMFFIFRRRTFASPPLSPSSLSLLESSSSVVKSSGPRSSEIVPGECSCCRHGQKWLQD